MSELKLVSWNVNGIRAVMQKDFIESLKKMKADIVCIQETKAHPDQVDHTLSELGYNYEYWSSAEKKGYSGTAIFSKVEPISINYGLGIEEHDKEGRIITAEFENFYLVTVYTPNSKRALERLPYRKIWDEEFLKYVKGLESRKPVVFCGDLNAAHKELDVKNDKGNMTTATKPGNPGFTDQERKGFEDYLNADFLDTFREFYPGEEKFTWWTYMFNSRAKNVGWRLDYFLVSKVLRDNLKGSSIENDIFGSDHCPVTINLKF